MELLMFFEYTIWEYIDPAKAGAVCAILITILTEKQPV